MNRGTVVRSVVKAVKIYEELVKAGSPLPLSTLSKRVGINISTVHRLVNTLVDMGYVEQDEDGNYGLGLHSFEMANIITRKFDIKKLVRPYLKEIVESCNETCNLVVMENYEVVYLDQVESTNMVRMFASVGSRGPAYCTGSGKALLAYLDEDEIDYYLKVTDFKRYTDNTITEPDELKKELANIREQGYALDLEEMELGVRCVAAPFFGGDGDKLLGAISVSGPCTRITMDYLEDVLIPLVTEKAGQLTEKLTVA
ncbi:IclR family transcriptional regulator [Halothermothrix orenii]|uniref:Transcriptional regulator IclR n=1 Tax=Halothermothrix orenii (strain H 168 / OCM 544 / DSM 9562) TaxID=373903 RepID=B8CYL2_HALOH|nr:IclR family transcriptional regulator [Halothermothrix orenii]ACL70381.1 Transcriptional regulator IclR [Halothermothrix orenii H 168]